uniref:AK 1 n=1 Tax=Steinernema glaseri TaxID=37863 RepID=A0A1I8ATI1_9BILA
MSLISDKTGPELSPLNSSNLPVFFIVGGPGSGKGTQCEKIVNKYGFTHISSGDLLREEVRSGSIRGQEMEKIIQAGQLAPLRFILDAIKEKMSKAIELGTKGFLIDGYPRDVQQGEQFEAEIQICKLVFYFEVDDEILIERLLKRARSDDNKETIKRRLETFHAVTSPVIEHYKKQGKLVQIKCQGSADEIFTVISEQIDSLCT